MKWYDYIILKFENYRTFVFLVLICFFFGAMIDYFTNESFVGLLLFGIAFVFWCLFWLIASYFYRKNLKK